MNKLVVWKACQYDFILSMYGKKVLLKFSEPKMKQSDITLSIKMRKEYNMVKSTNLDYNI